MSALPDADVVISEPLVRALLGQHPAYADLPVRSAGHGWDNELWRLGDGLAVRLPRRASAVSLLRNEIRWTRVIAARVRVPVPVVVAAGEPDADYPYPWAIVRWLEGVPATELAPERRDEYAADLGAFLRDVHVPAVGADLPSNPVRGVPLAARDVLFRERVARLPALEPLLTVWESGRAAAPYAGPPVWLHGDPHPLNCLVDSAGALSGVLDFGDITTGDPASDLAVGWAHFTRRGRAVFRDAVGVDDATWLRARGWAASYASSFYGLAPSDPLHAVARHVIAELTTR
ncbi:phosphotransferase [Epidermidibacterium keratini]|uniref:Phosphotransferase n=1 Tax=Epidermidibacterium keratini TaxID=1891644 RepID=A0A7L4YKD2_9ACTN|nr:aminoglycoside phosphotransferase family protein [Epidermidibacterium keratini]QHB99517.1 phosphotransferase [Epidermidibacterium keratini]